MERSLGGYDHETAELFPFAEDEGICASPAEWDDPYENELQELFPDENDQIGGNTFD